MEFRLNKIDPDLRQRINEERAEGKVHTKKEININRDKNEEQKREDRQQDNKDSKRKIKKVVLLRYTSKKVIEEMDKDSNDDLNDGGSFRGHNIDVRK